MRFRFNQRFPRYPTLLGGEARRTRRRGVKKHPPAPRTRRGAGGPLLWKSRLRLSSTLRRTCGYENARTHDRADRSGKSQSTNDRFSECSADCFSDCFSASEPSASVIHSWKKLPLEKTAPDLEKILPLLAAGQGRDVVLQHVILLNCFVL